MDLVDAVRSNNLGRLTLLLQHTDPTELNRTDYNTVGFSVLHEACLGNHHEAVEILLKQPGVDVNLASAGNLSPIHLAIASPQAVRVLVKDPRVICSMPDSLGFTPLWWATKYRGLEVIKLLLCYRGGQLGAMDGVLREAQEQGNAEILTLLARFAVAPEAVRQRLRNELVLGEVADLFSIVVFLSDDLLVLRPESSARSEPERTARRFFAMATRLPIEVQMTLCHRAFQSTRSIILSSESALAFGALAKVDF